MQLAVELVSSKKNRKLKIKIVDNFVHKIVSCLCNSIQNLLLLRFESECGLFSCLLFIIRKCLYDQPAKMKNKHAGDVFLQKTCYAQ